VYTRMRMLKEMAQGMNWLHESKPQIIHRDLKPANLLVDANMTVKVCDFGLSAVKENKAEKLQDKDAIPGTPLFLAPEVI
jgi:serine/threonine protein kinase